jgi:hypothetical protein
MSHLLRAIPAADRRRVPKPTVFIGMPVYDGVKAQTVVTLNALTEAMNDRGVAYRTLLLPGISLLELARARVASAFLQNHATHLLMVDADMEFAPDVVMRMLDADVDLIGVSAPMKQLDLDKMRAAVLAERSNWRTAGMETTAALGEKFEVVRGAAKVVDGVGTGLLLAKRTVIQRVHDAHPELMFRNTNPGAVKKGVEAEHICLMFRSGIRDGVYYGEDIGFCRLWRELGGEVHVLVDADIGHHGSYCYRANLDDIYDPPTDSRLVTGCRSAGCRTLGRCLCSCKRCATECVGREPAPASPPVDEMIASLQRIAAMGDA